MKCTYQNYLSLNINGNLISLESIEHLYPYWCYPTNSKPIGLEGCILYCFIDGYDEMVFACNPESCVDSNVYPLAKSFEDFMRLILACGSANPIEQIGWMSKEKFEEHVDNERKLQTQEHKQILQTLSNEFDLSPMENPYEYVKKLQEHFDNSKIEYSDEYYEII